MTKIPQPKDIKEKEREDAMGAYLMMFASAGIGLPIPFVSLIASIIYFYLNKNKSDFVAFHSYQSLITQIPVSIINAIGIFWLIKLFFNNFENTTNFIVFLIFAVLINILYFIFSIVGAVRAKKGRFFYFLFFGRLAFLKYYGEKAQKRKKNSFMNIPPKNI